jgi:hypothetical protein
MSVKIIFDLETITHREIRVLQQALGELLFGNSAPPAEVPHIVSLSIPVLAPADPAESETPEPTASTSIAESPKKRGRKPKEVQPELPFPAEDEPQVPPVIEEVPSVKATGEPISEDKLREALGRYIQKHGMAAATDLCKDFGKTRISQISAECSEEEKQEFLRICNG